MNRCIVPFASAVDSIARPVGVRWHLDLAAHLAVHLTTADGRDTSAVSSTCGQPACWMSSPKPRSRHRRIDVWRIGDNRRRMMPTPCATRRPTAGEASSLFQRVDHGHAGRHHGVELLAFVVEQGLLQRAVLRLATAGCERRGTSAGRLSFAASRARANRRLRKR